MDRAGEVHFGHPDYFVFHLSHVDLDSRGSHTVGGYAAGNSAVQESNCQVDEEKVLSHHLCCPGNMSYLPASAFQRHLEPYGCYPSGNSRVRQSLPIVCAWASISNFFRAVEASVSLC